MFDFATNIINKWRNGLVIIDIWLCPYNKFDGDTKNFFSRRNGDFFN